MGLIGKTTPEKIWNFLKSKGLSSCGAAGLMGNLYAESGLNPQNLQNSYEKKLGHTDASYTAAVDNGSYGNFARDGAGYGLAQWTYHTRKAALLEYAKAAGKSIGDLETQLGFLMKELTEGYKATLSVLKSAQTVIAASNAVLTQFERPADQSDTVKTKRAGYGQKYYDQYAAGAVSNKKNGGTSNMNVSEVRKKFAARAAAYVGVKEGTAAHHAIIDAYNNHKPLAQGYKVTYRDAWCATFGSKIAIEAGYTDIIPTECSCDRQIKLWQQMGRWCENDAKVLNRATISIMTGTTTALVTAQAVQTMWALWKAATVALLLLLRATSPMPLEEEHWKSTGVISEVMACRTSQRKQPANLQSLRHLHSLHREQPGNRYTPCREVTHFLALLQSMAPHTRS